MASVSESVDRYVREGMFPASAALTARRLREADPDLLPPTAKGASKNAPQVEPSHLLNLLLAQAAHLPIDAAKAVHALRDLRFEASETLFGSIDEAAPIQPAVMNIESLDWDTLGNVLDTLIRYCGDPENRNVMRQIVGHEWTLTLGADGPWALISQRRDNSLDVVTYGDRKFVDRAQRQITLPFRAILIAGELWQSTCEHRGQIFAPSVTTVETTGAPGRAPVSRAQPAQNADGTDSLISSDPTPPRTRGSIHPARRIRS